MKKLLLILLGLACTGVFAQIKSYSTIENYLNTNVNANGAQKITGAILNTALVDYLLDNQPNAIYDTSRSYQVGQFCVKDTMLYFCKAATSGVFDAADWTMVSADSSNFWNINGNSIDDDALVEMGRAVSQDNGYSLSVKASGAKSGATNATGGTLGLYGGVATGSGSSSIEFYTATTAASGTADRTPSKKLTIDGNGFLTGTYIYLTNLKTGLGTATVPTDYSIYLGAGTGNLSGTFNNFQGFFTGSTGSGSYNTLISPYSTVNGDYNNVVAFNAFTGSATGDFTRCSGMGVDIFQEKKTGLRCLAFGDNAFTNKWGLTTDKVAGTDNIAIGSYSLRTNNDLGNGIYAIGYYAGYNASTGQRLYIAYDTIKQPLIYGEFDNEKVKVNGEVQATKGFRSSFTDNLTSATNDTLFSIPLAADSTVNITMSYGINATDGDTTLGESGQMLISAVNYNGTLQYSFVATDSIQPTGMLGTLSKTLTCSLASNVLYAIVNVTSSISPSVLKIRCTPDIHSAQSITIYPY